MDSQELQGWEAIVDDQTLLTRDLPTEYPTGSIFIEEKDPPRHWQMLECVAGKAGARWAYWSKKDKFQVIADSIFNGDATHFIGMLGVPYSGKLPGIPSFIWVLLSPRMIPPPEEKIIEEKARERYERSREIYDVETGESRTI